MKLAFTICAANYLGRAKVLGDTLLAHNPDFTFVIVVADRLTGVDLGGFENFLVLPIESFAVPGIEEMIQRYNAIELCTAIKPACFAHLMRVHPSADSVLYLDPDMMLFGPLAPLERELDDCDVLLTPHLTKPMATKPLAIEFETLVAGVYNLGFIGLRACPNTMTFLEWWALRLQEHCRQMPKLGLFYDQSWVAFAPIFFDGVKVTKHLGFNVAHWNLHERRLKRLGDGYLVNETVPLVFFHFSGFRAYAPNSPEAEAGTFWRMPVSRPDVDLLCADYRERLIAARHFTFTQIPFAFARPPAHITARVAAICLAAMARMARRIMPKALRSQLGKTLAPMFH